MSKPSEIAYRTHDPPQGFSLSILCPLLMCRTHIANVQADQDRSKQMPLLVFLYALWYAAAASSELDLRSGSVPECVQKHEQRHL